MTAVARPRSERGEVPLPGLLVIGRLPELDGALAAELRVERVSAMTHEILASRPAAIVVDLRDVSLDALLLWRRHGPDPAVPILLAAARGVDDEVVEAVGAVDVIELDRATPGGIARRLRLVVELGRERLVTAVVADGSAGRSLSSVSRDCPNLEVLDAIDLGIVTAGSDARITYLNRAARELLELDDAALGADSALTFDLAASPAELLEHDPRQTSRVLCLTGTGAEAELELTIGRSEEVREDGGSFYFIFRDAREDRRRELERRRFEHLAAMGTMVAGFAHEVRNPVAALRSLTEELAEELAGHDLHLQHPSRMLRVLERMERLVRTSLQFGRPATPRRASHRPWTICSAALAGVGPRTMAAGEEIRVDMDSGLPDVLVDEGQLVQAIVILLDNALDAAERPSKVLLRVKRSAPREAEPRARKTATPPPLHAWLRFEVLDEGPGIDPSALPRIFDPFYTTKPSGTGLGLPIAQQIATDNGGRIELESSVGGPTIFSLLLPAADDAD